MAEDPYEGVRWVNGLDLGINAIGWTDEDRENPFDRFPLSLKSQIPQKLWNLGTTSAGLYIDFRVAATDVFVRWTLEGEHWEDAYAAGSGISGVDLYGRNFGGKFLWVGNHHGRTAPNCEGRLNRNPLDGQEREYRLYLPLRKRVTGIEVGARETITALPRDTRKPIAYYGTSIVHGAGVSRPGLGHAQLISRALDREVINLGVCGHAQCEPPIIEALTRLDPCLFIIDVLPNNSADVLAGRLTPLIEALRKERPNTPLLLIGERRFGDASFMPNRDMVCRSKNRELDKILIESRSASDRYLHADFVLSYYGDDFEGATDANHPNDLGAARLAEALIPTIQRILG